MDIRDMALKPEESAIFALRELYGQYGYTQYKMNKFEEYDLYVQNKDFLISDSVITFTDTDGKLLALKPDVTLSIIKNGKANSQGLQKVFYDENVYRVSKGARAFREITQVGLECVGPVDDYCVYEVLMLAVQSLRTIHTDCVLDVSHLGIVSDVMTTLGLRAGAQGQILQFLSEKSVHEIRALCQQEQISQEGTAVLCQLAELSAPLSRALNQLSQFAAYFSPVYLQQLQRLAKALESGGYGDCVRLDFSVIHDRNYYNGLVFKGFVPGIPAGILSGGSYDRLMEKMGRNGRAIGFAVYLDMLENLQTNTARPDVDVMLIYDPSVPFEDVIHCVNNLRAQGKRVMAQPEMPEKVTYLQQMKLDRKGAHLVEYDH